MKRGFIKNQHGQAMVELALVLPILLILLMSIIEFGRVYHSYLIITNASREGARVAVLGKTDSDITNRVNEVSSGLDLPELQTTITPSSAARTSGVSTTVEVRYRISLVFSLFDAFVPNPLTITSRTIMRVE